MFFQSAFAALHFDVVHGPQLKTGEMTYGERQHRPSVFNE